MKIDITKGRSKTEYSDTLTSSTILEMTTSIRKICFSLSCPHASFNVKEAFNEIKEYVNSYDRLLYAEISAYCYGLDNEETDNFQGNVNSLVEYIYSKNFTNGIDSLQGLSDTKEIDLREKTKRIIIKLYDNVNLACAQLNSFNRSSEELQQAVQRRIVPMKEEIVRDMSSQLITLVGIFTAIAFLVFGGFDTLLSIFSNIDAKPLSKTIMIGALWGLVVCNGLVILLSFIEKITTKTNNKNTIINSPLSQWANLIILTIFLSSLLVYVVDLKNYGGYLLSFVTKHCDYVLIAGIILIILFVYVGIKTIKNTSATKNQDSSK